MKSWKMWMAVAASIILVLAVGRIVVMNVPFGGSTGGNSGGRNEGSVFMSYAGPVFPLTLDEDGVQISACRNIDFDFSPYRPTIEEHESHDGKIRSYTRYDSELIVSDQYILTNSTNQEMTLSGVYPFAGSLNDQEDIMPKISVDGSIINTELMAGPYTGSFQGAYGENNPDNHKTLNLAYINSWEGYKALLSRGDYMERSFDDLPLLDQKVTVYEFSNISADHDKGNNPTLNIEFDMDFDRTYIFTYGFNGGSMDYGEGYRACHFSVPEESYSNYGMNRYLIVMGDDIDDYLVQGYPDGGCEEGEEIEGVKANIDRYESTLGQALWKVMVVYNDFQGDHDERLILDTVSDEMLLGLSAELLEDYGILAEEPKDRYDMGMLEDVFSEVKHMDRVIYLSFESVIPPGQSISVEANMVKEHSFDYEGSGSENMNIDGYDMVTRLGSNLTFTEQTASIQDHDLIEIVRQNFGFDIEKGIREVTLDMDEEHYYMEIKTKLGEETDK